MARPKLEHSAVSTDQRDRAKQLFEEGLALAQQQDYLAAASSFERAQALVPHPRTILNLGLAYAELGRAVKACDRLREYLELAANDNSVEHLASVRSLIERLLTSTGLVRFDAPPGAATVAVDGAVVNATTLHRMDAGWHTAALTVDGYHPHTTRFWVTPQQTTLVALKVSPLPKLTIECSAPDVRVLRKNRLLGTTDGIEPLTIDRLQPSETYILSRSDYWVQQAFVDSTTLTLKCSAIPKRSNAQLYIDDLADGAKLEVDGSTFANGSTLPEGKHRLRVTQPGFHDHVATFDVFGSHHLSLDPVLRPTKRWHDEYLERAGNVRLAGQIALVSGLVLALAGASVLLANTARLEDMTRRGELQNTTSSCGAGRELSQTARSICTWDTYGYVGLGVGVAAALSGAGLWWFGPDPHRYERNKAIAERSLSDH